MFRELFFNSTQITNLFLFAVLVTSISSTLILNSISNLDERILTLESEIKRHFDDKNTE